MRPGMPVRMFVHGVVFLAFGNARQGFVGKPSPHPVAKAEAGENPMTLDSKDPTVPYQDFIMGETRYSALKKQFPEVAAELFDRAEKEAKEKIDYYKKLDTLE